MKTTTRRCLLSLLGFSAAPILTACYGMPYYDEYLDIPFDGFSGKIVDIDTQEPIPNIKVHFTEQPDSSNVVEHSTFTDAEGRFLTVSLGIFSVVRIVRPGQYLVHASEYCAPDKECVSPENDDPCAIFRHMAFPASEFCPSGYISQKGDHGNGKCGC